MAKENGEPTAAEKGKGKMKEDVKPNGEKAPEEIKRDKDGKPILNGKKDEEPKNGLFAHPIPNLDQMLTEVCVNRGA